MKKTLLFSFAVVVTQYFFAQNEPFFNTYTWNENPSYVADENSEESIIAFKDKIVTEFYFREDNSLVEYFMEHRVLWLNSDEKIESYNKIYLPYSSTSKLEINKARVITKEGKVLELDESKILTAEDEETKQQYKYFAFEGIEKGSFIEYYYVVRRYPAYKGKKLNFQAPYPKREVAFDLYAPKNLVFKFKSYNGLPSVVKDTIIKEKLHWRIQLDAVDGLEKESLSAYNASKQHLVYKLDRNLVNNNSDISSYGNVSQNLYSFYYPEYPKKTNVKIEAFIKEILNESGKSEEAKLRKLEFFIKNNVFLTEGNGEELSDLDKILEGKIANETGLIKLYIAVLRTLNIKHEIVFTSNRLETKFDNDFEANNFLTDFLIYFPQSDAYLSPGEPGSRFGYPPAYLTDNYGLFVKEISVGDFKSGVGKIKYIKPIPAQNTFDTMILNVEFDTEDITNNIIKLDRSLNGYYAMYIHPYMGVINEDDKKTVVEGYAKNISEDIEILDKKVVNDDPELFGVKPLQFVIDFSSDAFVEKAGNKYLFKVGELIGPQMQLYQEKKRVLPLENEFHRSYYRTINIHIPEGYKVSNLDDINIDNTYTKDGEELLSFKSFYEIKDNLLHITADEHYRINIIDTALYEDYRKVINSAADFNKITLVLEPIK